MTSAIGVGLFEIVPKEKYTDEDLDWTNKNNRSTIEMKNPNSRPEIAKKLSKYGYGPSTKVGIKCFIVGDNVSLVNKEEQIETLKYEDI